MAADGGAFGSGDLAGAVGVDGESPAEVVEQDMVVPPAVILEVSQAGGAAVMAVDDVVGSQAEAGRSQPPGYFRNPHRAMGSRRRVARAVCDLLAGHLREMITHHDSADELATECGDYVW